MTIGYDNKALNFLDSLGGTDQSGRTIHDYFDFGTEVWEGCHDVIQWAFPTKTMSAFNSNAPTLPEFITYNGPESALRINSNLDALLQSYLSSLGIEITEVSIKYFSDRNNNWLYPGNHNYKRFTRIIECLECFGHSRMRQRFVEFLLYELAPRYPREIGVDTVVFWMATWENKRDLILVAK